MSTELQKLQNIDDIVRMGKVFYESGMFDDLKNMAAAIVKVQAGTELGIPPFQAIGGVHIIKGKAVIGAGLMASMVDRHPEYDFEVLQQGEKVCEIKFFKNGKVRGVSKFTEEDARKAGTQNMGKFPANMLYARAMSNGVKWFCPGVFAGPVFVPEEFEEPKTEDTTYTEVKQQEQEPVYASQKQLDLIANRVNSHHIPDDYKDYVASSLEEAGTLTSEEAGDMIEKMQGLIDAGMKYESSTPATAEQIRDIEILLENAAFSPDEQQAGKAKLEKGYSIAQANKRISQLDKLIEERSKALLPSG